MGPVISNVLRNCASTVLGYSCDRRRPRLLARPNARESRRGGGAWPLVVTGMAAVALGVAGCANVASLNQPLSYYAVPGTGGSLHDAAMWEHDRYGRTAIIDGPCVSMCVMYIWDLGQRDPGRACITSRARFGLHMFRRYDLAKQGARVRLLDPIYAPTLINWANDHGGIGVDYTWMGFEDARRYWRVCTPADWKGGSIAPTDAA
jgi:hypothetical protein